MAAPLCSVITPTWRRHKLLLERCVPSVLAQTYPKIEHVIVSDGPDENLRDGLAGALSFRPHGYRLVRYDEVPAHDPAGHWGHHARLRGISASGGEYITYCDDDDSLRPEHCALLAAALDEDPGAGFAVSRMMCHGGPQGKSVTGWGPLACGNVGSPMIMHRREILEHGTWGPASFTEDWDLVARWLDAGIRYANVNAETCDVWPSRFRGEGPS